MGEGRMHPSVLSIFLLLFVVDFVVDVVVDICYLLFISWHSTFYKPCKCFSWWETDKCLDPLYLLIRLKAWYFSVLIIQSNILIKSLIHLRNIPVVTFVTYLKFLVDILFWIVINKLQYFDSLKQEIAFI